MRRLLATTALAAAALATAVPASADHPDDSCHKYVGPRYTVGVCAGVRCNDICAPEPYAYLVCDFDGDIAVKCGGIH